MEVIAKDSPTHRMHLLQATMIELKEWTTDLQRRRNLVVEKIARAKASSKLSRAATVNKQLNKALTKITEILTKLEIQTADVEDRMNKARAMFFELSDGEVILEKTEIKDGTPKGARNRADATTGTAGPEIDQDHLRDGGANESAAPADHAGS